MEVKNRGSQVNVVETVETPSISKPNLIETVAIHKKMAKTVAILKDLEKTAAIPADVQNLVTNLQESKKTVADAETVIFLPLCCSRP